MQNYNFQFVPYKVLCCQIREELKEWLLRRSERENLGRKGALLSFHVSMRDI
jgi:hypothetical protein